MSKEIFSKEIELVEHETGWKEYLDVRANEKMIGICATHRHPEDMQFDTRDAIGFSYDSLDGLIEALQELKDKVK